MSLWKRSQVQTVLWEVAVPDNLANNETFISLRRDLPLDLNLLQKAWRMGYERAAFDVAVEEIKRLKNEVANLKQYLESANE